MSDGDEALYVPYVQHIKKGSACLYSLRRKRAMKPRRFRIDLRDNGEILKGRKQTMVFLGVKSWQSLKERRGQGEKRIIYFATLLHPFSLICHSSSAMSNVSTVIKKGAQIIDQH